MSSGHDVILIDLEEGSLGVIEFFLHDVTNLFGSVVDLLGVITTTDEDD